MDSGFLTLPSRHQIGDHVAVRFVGGENCGLEIRGYVRSVTFTSSKVRYAILVPAVAPQGTAFPDAVEAVLSQDGVDISDDGMLGFTLHGIVSELVYPLDGGPLEMPPDNG